MDQKEKIILNSYKIKFENNSFNEADIYGFLILIRSYIRKNNSIYKYIEEFCDLVAHRKRNKGIIMDSICIMIDKNYYTTKNGSVSSFCGINTDDWINEWKILSQKLKLNLSQRNIDEITMCIFSLSQNTYYDNKNHIKKTTSHHRGYVKLIVDNSNNICLLCTVGRKDSKFVVLAKYKNVINNLVKNKIVNDVILLYRDKNNNLVF